MKIGEKIRERRIELGLTQDELAQKLGYKSRSSVNKVELANDLTLKTVRMYAQALNLDVGYLMGWDEQTFSSDNAHMISQIRNDVELTDALKVYFSLPKDKKKYVCDLIKMLSN